MSNTAARALGSGLPLLATTVVGSYPQPDWLIDRDQLSHRVPPRVPAREIRRVQEPFLEQAQEEVEPVEVAADRVRAALRYISPERLIVAPDCGMKYLSRSSAFGKLSAMTQAVDPIRSELSGKA